jgi:hypothetical protein
VQPVGAIGSLRGGRRHGVLVGVFGQQHDRRRPGRLPDVIENGGKLELAGEHAPVDQGRRDPRVVRDGPFQVLRGQGRDDGQAAVLQAFREGPGRLACTKLGLREQDRKVIALQSCSSVGARISHEAGVWPAAAELPAGAGSPVSALPHP